MSNKTVKFCNGCKNKKNTSMFYKESRSKNGYKPRCKKCMSAYDKMYYMNKNKEKKISYAKKYYEEHKNQILYNNSLLRANPEHKKARRIYNKEYRKKNIVVLRKKANEYQKAKSKSDPDFRLRKNFTKLIYHVKNKKTNKAHVLLGYTRQELIESLGRYPNKNESIDHKIPITWFKNGTDVKIINHLDNLQILKKSNNFKKNNKYAHAVDKKYFKKCIQFIKPQFKNKVYVRTA